MRVTGHSSMWPGSTDPTSMGPGARSRLAGGNAPDSVLSLPPHGASNPALISHEEKAAGAVVLYLEDDEGVRQAEALLAGVDEPLG